MLKNDLERTILLFGDIHGDFAHVAPLVRQYRPEAIILLGDMEAPSPLEQVLSDVTGQTQVWWIPGNHDSDNLSSYHHLFDSALADRNLHGRVVEIAGLRVAGLGGVFRESIWYPRLSMDDAPRYPSYRAAMDVIAAAERAKVYRQDREHYQSFYEVEAPLIGKALTHKTSVFYEEWARLGDQRADILVTHEAPSCHLCVFHAIRPLSPA